MSNSVLLMLEIHLRGSSDQPDESVIFSKSSSITIGELPLLGSTIKKIEVSFYSGHSLLLDLGQVIFNEIKRAYEVHLHHWLDSELDLCEMDSKKDYHELIEKMRFEIVRTVTGWVEEKK